MKELDIILPVYNEALTLESFIDELVSVLEPLVEFRMILVEDGSDEATKACLKRLEQRPYIFVDSRVKRRGYNQALKDGLFMADAPYVFCIDSDGQCDPAHFPAFWEKREQCDVRIGYRKNRKDAYIRILLSRIFHSIYSLFFRVTAHDPSCNMILFRREKVSRFLEGVGVLKCGFWWEFVAYASELSLSVSEIEIKHRYRVDKKSRSIGIMEIPYLALLSVFQLFSIRRDILRLRECQKV